MNDAEMQAQAADLLDRLTALIIDYSGQGRDAQSADQLGCRHGYTECEMCNGDEKILRLASALSDMRDRAEKAEAEVARLRRIEEAAREITRWDWLHLLIDHPDAETLAENVKRLDAALEGDNG